MQIRELNPIEPAEIRLVAERMRDTLVEVEGEERGRHMYTLEWLEARVRWHLDPNNTMAQVLLAIDADGAIVGHTIYRIELAESEPFGLISTTYVVPSARNAGWAAKLLTCTHDWFIRKGVSLSCTWTSATNTPLIGLYTKFGYEVVDRGPNDITGTTMIKLGRSLVATAT